MKRPISLGVSCPVACASLCTPLQVRFGPWAMADGETPNLSSAECDFFKEQGFDWIFQQVGG